ncbi:phosphoribosylanthranilate isomerase [Tenuifilum osseticum]|uniref:phosphoribosylanthranilate isomerase n=1 Tax=Tenuifilum osseticum TaxID=3374723 RepID=UPI0034E4C02B
MKLKICGITDKSNIARIVNFHPDFLGFIFFSGSQRDVSDRLSYINFELIPVSIKKVAVFVNENTHTIKSIVQKYGFTHIQLHGDESPEQCKEVQTFASVIKVFRVQQTIPSNLGDYEGCCNYFLFDTYGKEYGGNGVPFNHSVISDYNLTTPFFLSGGIGPKDALYLNKLKFPKLYAVDVNSRFESEPGLKDIRKLEQFIKQLNRHELSTQQ